MTFVNRTPSKSFLCVFLDLTLTGEPNMAPITSIEDRRICKPFLGGYRNKITGTEYPNAASQTGPKRVVWKNARTCGTQSVEIAEAGTQSVRNGVTQTWRRDLYIASSSDVIVTVKSYETYATMQKRLNLDGHARTIQRAYRAHRLLKYIKECAEHYRNKLEKCRKLKIEKAEFLRKRHENDVIRQTFPRSRADFDKLYNLIERWRTARLEVVKKIRFVGSWKAENRCVLEKMTEMLKTLDNRRRDAITEKRGSRRIRFLTRHCKAVKWHGYKGKRIEMLTLRIQKAQDYRHVYESLMKNYKTVEERIELLILLRISLKNHSCRPVEIFVNLVDQEIVLLSNGVKSAWLNNLRKRITVAYLNLASETGRCICIDDIEDPLNLKFSDDVTDASTRKLLCKSCMKMLPHKSFTTQVRTKKLSYCLGCSWLRQQNIDKLDYGPYTFLLNAIRADEQRQNCYTPLIYAMREPEIYHLVNNIWHSRSIVSENDDIFDLRLVRFNVVEEWSPWNCILLTSEEAETHYHVKDLRAFYSKRLLQRIRLAHEIAKMYFNVSRLIDPWVSIVRMVIVVEIEDRCFAKSFLGGWRNVKTGTEYHDAVTQTCPEDNVAHPRVKTKRGCDPLAISYYERGTNVIAETRDRSVGTATSVLESFLAPYRCKYTSVARERAVQTSCLPDLRDKLLTPYAIHPQVTRSTEDRYELLSRITDTSRKEECSRKCINISPSIHSPRAYRALDIEELARLSTETRTPTLPNIEKIHHFRHCRSSRFEILNFSPPTSRADFEMLRSVLERWHFYENARLERDLFVTSKSAARSRTLAREIDLLRSIEMIKSRVYSEIKQRKYLIKLDKLAQSEVWSLMRGEKKILVDTPRVIEARELRDFYRSLIDYELPCHERKKTLEQLRKYATEHTCKCARDVASLVDQEIQLYAINCDPRVTNSLRKRLSLAVLRLTINSCGCRGKIEEQRAMEIAGTRKRPFTKQCKRCGKFLDGRYTSMRSHELLPTCQNCWKSREVKEAKIVYEPYEKMMQDLRIRESELVDSASLKSRGHAWFVEPRIIYRLVNYVWHGKSAISECDDLYRLVLVRFVPDKVWSPWNNLVLTRHEAALHQAMDNPWDIYAPPIMKKFIVKNLQAKLRFYFGPRNNFQL